jgi:hypothetical protein
MRHYAPEISKESYSVILQEGLQVPSSARIGVEPLLSVTEKIVAAAIPVAQQGRVALDALWSVP